MWVLCAKQFMNYVRVCMCFPWAMTSCAVKFVDLDYLTKAEKLMSFQIVPSAWHGYHTYSFCHLSIKGVCKKCRYGRRCWSCPIGQYKDVDGNGNCKKCPRGYTTSHRGQTNATQCGIERHNSYYFFLANQQKVGTQIYSLTQCSLTVNKCDWHILAGNDKRINSHCLTRDGDGLFRYTM